MSAAIRSQRALEIARRGSYGRSSFRRIEDAILKTYFHPSSASEYAVNEAVRRLCRMEFVQANLSLADAQWGEPGAAQRTHRRTIRCHLLPQSAHLLRASASRTLLNGLAARLHGDGYLFLGHSESLHDLNTPFVLDRLAGELVYRLAAPSRDRARIRRRLDPCRGRASEANMIPPSQTSQPSLKVPSGSSGGASPTRPGPLRIIIVDDQATIRQAICDLLKGARDIEIVGQAADGGEGLMLVHNVNPDAILLDLEMPRLDGFYFPAAPRWPSGQRRSSWFLATPRASVFRALELGAMEFVAKPTRISGAGDLQPIREDLLQKLRMVRSLRLRRWPRAPEPSGRCRRQRPATSSADKRARWPMRCVPPPRPTRATNSSSYA